MNYNPNNLTMRVAEAAQPGRQPKSPPYQPRLAVGQQVTAFIGGWEYEDGKPVEVQLMIFKRAELSGNPWSAQDKKAWYAETWLARPLKMADRRHYGEKMQVTKRFRITKDRLTITGEKANQLPSYKQAKFKNPY